MKTATFLFLGVVAATLAVALVYARSAVSLHERTGHPMGERIEKTDDEWRQILTPEQFHVTRQKGTERAFSGKYAQSKEKGVFTCVCCSQPLFDSDTKYDSGTGWPSFWKPIDDDHVSLIADSSLFMRRVEATCSRCDAHLGHVFEDGPAPTGLRCCINSASLQLIPKKESN